MRNWPTAVCLWLLATLVSPVKAQVPSGACSCSPTVFNFTLDLDLSCPGNLVEPDGAPSNEGILNITCRTAVLSESTDEVPVVIDSVTVRELNADSVINSQEFLGPFSDGDVITFESISATEQLTDVLFPFALRLDLFGENADGATVVNTFTVLYTADCDEWPVYPEGATVGWVEIVSIDIG